MSTLKDTGVRDDTAANLERDGAKELLSFDSKLASIRVVPNKGEAENPNFPRNVHNAAELFLKVGHVGSATKLHETTSNLLRWYAEGPDGKTTHSMGRGCICWQCGYAGIPKNAEACHKVDVTPAGICGNCGSDVQTNFLRPTVEGNEIPWMELKAKPIDGAPDLAEKAPVDAIPLSSAQKAAKSTEITELTKSCADCGSNDAKLMSCARCKKVWYCSTVCQKRHWKQGGHKESCA
eukprot:m.156788 g.156788  ORF g.156788 m.156788 type:complete len:236 (-) comp31025_c2_seq1:415-1122(-)